MKVKTVPVIFLLAMLLVSCVTVDSVSVDYLCPADVSFPASVRTVGVVNNTLPGGKADDVKWLNENHAVNEVAVAVTEGDGQATAEQLAGQVADANYFDMVVVCDSALRTSDIITRETKLASGEVRTLADNLGVDLILSLEQVKLFLRKSQVYYPEIPFAETAIDATVRTVVRLYLPGRNESLVSLSDTDSIYWTGQRRFTEEMMQDVSGFAASMPLRHVVPTWKTAVRYYYDGGGVEMRDAAVCVREDDWDGAYALWQTVYGRKNKKMKMRAAYNMALYCETKDKLDEARELLEQALEMASEKIKKDKDGNLTGTTTDYTLMVHYYSDLMERISQLPKLNAQMQRFDGDF